MGGHLLLPGLLLALPLATGWMVPNCLVIEGSQLPLVSRYFLLCPVDASLSLFARCHSVSNLTQALAAVPHNVEGLCLSGSISVLPPDAFSQFPGLKVLKLNLCLTQLLPGALRGLGQLRKLLFMDSHMRSLLLPPDAFSNLSSLQHLAFWGPCLEGNTGVRFPPNLLQLSIRNTNLRNVGLLASIFPDLVLGSSQGDAWTLDALDLSFNQNLTVASPGALRGLKLGLLNLDHTRMDAAAVMGLGLQRLNNLSAINTYTAELPAAAAAYFELQELNLGNVPMQSLVLEALAPCYTLQRLGLMFSHLRDLPAGLLAAMPRLQRLNLSGNQLQRVSFCTETRIVSGLRVLNLSHNRLQALLPATFSCLPHLRELCLEGNQLVCLDSQVFQGLRSLETLNLLRNPLANLSKGWLSSLPTLTTLNLQDTRIEWTPAWGFWGPESLHKLSLQLPSGPSGAVLSLPTGLTSLELQAAPSKHWELAPSVFPSLQTLTLHGWGLQLGTQNITEIFPALLHLSLLGNSLVSLCSQDTTSFFLWQLPRLQYLLAWGNGHSPRPCCITGLPSLRELKLQDLQSKAQPRPVRLEELVGELPSLEVLHLFQTGVETLSASVFQGLGRLQILVLDQETGLVLDSSLQDYSPQMPQYLYLMSAQLACHCANAWVGPWLERSPRTYIHITSLQQCQSTVGDHHKNSLFPYLWSHCPNTLGLELFLGSSALLFLLIFLPLLLNARNSWLLYLQALFRTWLQGLRGQRGQGKRFLYDVFVSHSRQDQGWVLGELLPALEGCSVAGRELRLCLPERDFEPGKDVVDNVVESMAGSQATLCVVSHQALRTPRCCLELRLATSLLLAAPCPPLLLLIFLEPVSRHELPRYHRLAWLLRRGDYCVWPKEEERKDAFWAWLRGRLGQPGLD